MKIIMPGLSGPDWDGHIVGWAPGHVTEIPDDNPKAVAWARGWLEHGAVLVEDTPKVKEPPKPPEPPAKPVPPEDTRTVEDLRVELKARGLPVYGSKQDLLDRLAKNA